MKKVTKKKTTKKATKTTAKKKNKPTAKAECLKSISNKKYDLMVDQAKVMGINNFLESVESQVQRFDKETQKNTIKMARIITDAIDEIEVNHKDKTVDIKVYFGPFGELIYGKEYSVAAYICANDSTTYLGPIVEAIGEQLFKFDNRLEGYEPRTNTTLPRALEAKGKKYIFGDSKPTKATNGNAH